MKKTSIVIIVTVLLIVMLGFLYTTRPVSAPTQSVDVVSTSSPTGTSLYRISQAESQVKFSIGEILNGKPFTVVGTTAQVGGDIMVSKDSINVNTMTVNAKTFKTDSSRRDGAIVRFILKSDLPENELIVFTASKPMLLSAPLVENTEITASISGNLTISGITKPAVFEVKIQTSGESLIVTGETTVKRSDFNLKIPELAFIASVDDSVEVSISVVASMIP